MFHTDAHIFIDQTILDEENLFDFQLAGIDTRGLKVECRNHPVFAYASLDWGVPALIFVYLSKPYFEGFLNEMGSDHYKRTKKWLLSLQDKIKNVHNQNENSKILDSQFDNFFALYIKTPKGNLLKIFMPNCQNEKENNKG